jgi:hypothetical protein
LLQAKGQGSVNSLPDLLLTYGPLGVMVLLLIIPAPGSDSPFLVPWWYIKKLNQEAGLKQVALDREQEAAKRALDELQNANRLIGELRMIAYARTGGKPDGPVPSPVDE